MNVLISSAGRRGKLVQLVQADLAEVYPTGKVVAIDCSRLSAAAHLASTYELVPPCTDPEFIDAVLDVCLRNEIGLIIPTIDTELLVYAEHRDVLSAKGIAVSVSAPAVVAIGANKMTTFRWLIEHRFQTVKTSLLNEVIASPDVWNFPSVVKPLSGSSSIGVSVAHSIDDLRNRLPENNLIVQELAGGFEYTADAWVDRSGQCRCAVLRQRLEVRAGEVSKGVTVKWPEMELMVTRLINALPGAYGAITVQFFAKGDDAKSAKFIEINPRYGGGYPLSWEAGARFPLWTIQDLTNVPSSARASEWQGGLVMLRFDESVYTTASEVGL